jgi:autotransporter translocation and assembly factor TamB
MSESDIISMLLFGQQLYQLDGGQEDLLQTRTNEILASYGAAQLQDQVGSQMGIDVISYGQGTDKDSTAGSLTVGKYLSPKVLMKYEKVLDKDSAYYVHLDYTIDRNFKLETIYGQSGNSGIAVKWGKDY